MKLVIKIARASFRIRHITIKIGNISWICRKSKRSSNTKNSSIKSKTKM